MKNKKFLKAGGYVALMLATTGMILPEIAAAAEQPGRSEHRGGGQREGGQRGGRPDRDANPSVRAQPSRRMEAPPRAPRMAPAERPQRAAPERSSVRMNDQRGPQRDWRSNDRQNAGSSVRVNQPNRTEVRREPPRNNAWRNDGRDQRDAARNVTRNDDRRNNAWRNDGRDDRRDNDRRDNDWRNNDRRDNDRRNDNWRNDRDRGGDRYGRDDRRWDSQSWRRDNRYDWRSYRDRHRSTYRIGRYYSPYQGYSYRRLNVGFYLGASFYGNRYWIDNPWSYRLPAVYGPYRWVRYYDDVMLVNIYTGEVVDVIYDFFW